MNRSTIFVILAIMSSLNSFGQDRFKTMFYNLLNFPQQSIPENRIDYLKDILLETQPDIFMVCELNNEAGADMIIDMIQSEVNPNFERASFQFNTSDDDMGNQNDLQNLVYFDSTKFSLEDEVIITTLFRDFNHYRFKLNTVDQDINPLFIDVIVAHLKSSDGGENQGIRNLMVQDLLEYLDDFPPESHVLLGGDLNLYRSTENAFENLTEITNNITFVDPAIDGIGNWHNNSDFVHVFTQSTRVSTGMGGASGGFDDRFDFIMTSESMEVSTENSDPDLYYVEGTYEIFGNNSNQDCFNQAIISENCAEDGDPTTNDYSLEVREQLFNFSDHLPVILEIESNQNFLSITEFSEHPKYYEIIGTNVVSNILHLRTNNQLLSNKELNIFNTLGQVVKSLPVANDENHAVDVSRLSKGIYYITTPNLNVEPLKFVKVN